MLEQPRKIRIIRKMHMGPTHMMPLHSSPMPPMAMMEKGDYMSVQNVRKLKDHANRLAGMVTPGIDLPDWAEQKLTLAADYVQSVCNHMRYGQKHGMPKARRMIIIKKVGV